MPASNGSELLWVGSPEGEHGALVGMVDAASESELGTLAHACSLQQFVNVDRIPSCHGSLANMQHVLPGRSHMVTHTGCYTAIRPVESTEIRLSPAVGGVVEGEGEVEAELGSSKGTKRMN